MTVGRPTKLTTDVQETIVAAIQRGAYIETAAEMAGISKQTFYDWLKKGANLAEKQEKGATIIRVESQNLIAFSDAVKRASAQSELRDIMVVDNAAQQGVWQAAAWKLERKSHQRWGRKVAITDEDGGNFFTGMARAWADALERDEDAIQGEIETPLLTNGSGNGSAQ